MPRENNIELPEKVAFLTFTDEDGETIIEAEMARFTVPNQFTVTRPDHSIPDNGVGVNFAEALSVMIEELTGKQVDVNITVHTE